MLIHSVRKGETLWQIAKAHNISLAALLAANPQIADPNSIVPGTAVNVPTVWQEETNPAARPDQEAVKPFVYTSQPGETLMNIAEITDTPLGKLIYYNRQFSRVEPLPDHSRVIIPARESYPAEIRGQNPRRR
ncbi:MAG: LysM peptidoglycan-binding domain-containing protein [Firmicutes bacterium]|nr:LysM peptidoglycan-binding domain-containing protein [Bacillota bacterium]